MPSPMKTILPRFENLFSCDLRRAMILSLSAACALLAASASADTKLITSGTPARYLVPTDGTLGTSWRDPLFNDSSWTVGQNGLGYEVTPGSFSARVIADSRGDWSTAGRQGANSWINGYYDKTGDPDATYQASDFQPFRRSDAPWGELNFWDGGAWNWYPDDIPWDTIGAIDVHPNGENSGGVEHWVMRRWSSTVNGPVTLRFHLRKANLSGSGVTGKVFKNGVELFSRAIAGNDGTGFDVYINTTAAVGDVFDFAQTPMGPGGDPADGADGSIMTATVLSGTFGPPLPPEPPAEPTPVADSVNDWSSTGVQGANGWYYGFYNQTADSDHTYNPNTDFNTTDPNWTFGGGAWTLGPGDPPWDIIGQTDWHPNGDNNLEVNWVIRRWVSDVDGDLYAKIKFGKSNPSGNGTTLRVFHNGTEVFSHTVAGSDSTGIDTAVGFPNVFVGDKIEFALDPLGTDGSQSDGADGSFLKASIYTGAPPPPPQTVVADSVTDWSAAGVQGANGWFYGFYNQTADADHNYNPSTDFNTTDPNWGFADGQWTLGPDDPPWDIIGQTDWHPNGDNNVEVNWVIKRWVSDVSGDLHATVKFGKVNPNGNGTTLRVLRNGTQIFFKTVAGNDTTGIDTAVALPSVSLGDTIEFALDPLGTDGSQSDGADGSFIRAAILTGLPPTPAQTVVADSVADWSSTGVQGANGWYYGIYNETADADQTYNPSSDFNATDPNWAFDGSSWQLGPGDPPWDIIGQTDWHPNGDNNVEVNWVIRRWVSDVDGDLHATIKFGKTNPNGNGTTLRVFHNATQVFSHTVAGNDSTGIDTAVALPSVFVGDTIEFALDPLGTDGSKNDGADGSFLRAAIITGLPPVPPEPPKPFVPGIADCFSTDLETAMRGVNPSVLVRIPFDVSDPAAIQTLQLKMKYNDGFAAYLNGTEIIKRNVPTSIAGTTVADSVLDWSTDPNVIVNGWTYGMYDQSADTDGTYSGGGDFTPFPHDGGGHSATDFWDGNGYDWFNGNPPWTELYQQGTHPAHPNGAAYNPADPTTHLIWNIRRWSSTVDANLKCRIRFRKTNAGCGDGVRVSVFHGPLQVYSQTIAFNDTIGRDDTIEIPDVFLGDRIDVMLGPGDITGNDYCDGSEFSAVLFEGEPTIPWDGAATSSRTTTETISPEVLDISSFISLLTPGVNVLAIQGFNAAVNDNEFLINTELLANRVPTAANDAVQARLNTPAAYPASLLLANDSDPDGDRLLLVGVTPSYTTARGGTVRLYGDTVRYVPPADFTGNDSFDYTTTDLSGVPSHATVVVTVLPPNRCPTNSPLAVIVDQNGSASFQLPAGDADGDSLHYSVTQPSHGVVIVGAQTGAATYTPAAGYCGLDSFTFKVSDGQCESAEATVSIRVNCCPTANSGTVTVDQDSHATFQLSASDPDGGALQYSITQPSTHGDVALDVQTGQVTYTPNAGYCGADSFKFKVSDGRCESAEAAIAISVKCKNLPPTCALQISCAYGGGSSSNGYVISVDGSKACLVFRGSGSDPDGDSLQFTWLIGTNFYGGAVISNCLPLGCHTILLAVGDGRGGTTLCETNICVINAGDAVDQLIAFVNDADLGPKKGKGRIDKRPLLATLKAAAKAFDRGRSQAGINELEAFQHKVQAQLGRTDPANAAILIGRTRQLLDAIDCIATVGGHGHNGGRDRNDDDDRGGDDDDDGGHDDQGGGRGRDR